MDKSNNYWNTLQSVSEWVRFSDTKAGVIITVYGVILTIIYSNAKEVYSAVSSSTLQVILVIMSGLLSVVSLWYCFLCLNPRLKNNNPTSGLYYGHIAKFTNHKEYLDLVSNKFGDESEFEKQITEQIYINSVIAWKKFNNVGWAIRFFFGSIIVLFVSMFVYLFL